MKITFDLEVPELTIELELILAEKNLKELYNSSFVSLLDLTNVLENLHCKELIAGSEFEKVFDYVGVIEFKDLPPQFHSSWKEFIKIIANKFKLDIT